MAVLYILWGEGTPIKSYSSTNTATLKTQELNPLNLFISNVHGKLYLQAPNTDSLHPLLSVGITRVPHPRQATRQV